MMRYIHERPEWPQFRWDAAVLAPALGALRLRQGRLAGRLESLGFPQRAQAELRARVDDALKSSEIEGELLDAAQVRSSVARRLGLEAAALFPADRKVEGVVEMTLEATRNYDQPLTRERLWRWHAALFPEPSSKVKMGAWRDDASGPMRVVSGGIGRERVHFEAPAAERLEAEMGDFLAWANAPGGPDPVLRAAQAHLWFVTVHPFDDGNGRVARAIADWALARSEDGPRRYYSMSAQIRREREQYYGVLERTQKGGLDVTDWMAWFLACLDRAIAGAEVSLEAVLEKDRFWKSHGQQSLNARQRQMLNRLLDGAFTGKLTSSRWAKVAKCSQDTAHRDIAGLVELGILVQGGAGGRSTSYALKPSD